MISGQARLLGEFLLLREGPNRVQFISARRDHRGFGPAINLDGLAEAPLKRSTNGVVRTCCCIYYSSGECHWVSAFPDACELPFVGESPLNILPEFDSVWIDGLVSFDLSL